METLPWVDVDTRQDTEVSSILHKSIVIDCLSGRIVNPEPPAVGGKSYVDRLIEAGYCAVNVTLAAHAGVSSFEAVLRNIEQYFSLFVALPGQVIHVKTVADIGAAHAAKKVGVIFGLQNAGTPVGENLWRWPILHHLGIRIAQLMYSERSAYGDGCKERENRGLTADGFAAIGEMNRLGIVLDLSHAGERSSFDAMETTTQPPIFSHSNPRAIGPSWRNITDEQIKRCAELGGVIGLSPHSELAHKKQGQRPSVHDYLDHLCYVADLVGTDHVGIGSDVYESYTKISWESKTKRTYKVPWIYETMLAEGYSKVTDIANVVRGLLDRGFHRSEISKILGENWLRIFKQVWRSQIEVA